MKQLYRERLRHAGLLALLLACCLAGAIRPAAAAGTYTVTSTLDDDSGTLRSAIAFANADPGATIVFAPGVSGVIALQGELDITTSMTIIGPGADVIAVDGGAAVRLFNITSPSAQVTISGLSISDGSAFNDPNNVTNGVGGGVYNAGTLTLSGCTVGGNTAAYGGGIYNVGTLALTGCTLSDNVVNWAGGGIYNVGALALAGCTLSVNSAFYAAGVYNSGTTALTDCTVTSNSAFANADGNSGAGAGLYNDGDLTLTGCVVSRNGAYGGSADDNGGTGGNGGGLYNGNTSTLTLTGCTVSDNYAGPRADGLYGLGGGLDNQGAATLTDDIFYGDYAASGAEIANDTLDSPGATVAASYCDIQGSSAGLTAFGPTNLDANPLFVSAPTDLHLEGESPCIGRGIADSANATDRDGNLRPNPPSIGAYEYTSAGLASLTFPSPVPGGTVVTATVTLPAVMPTDTLVGLSSSDSSVVRVHRAVIVPAGASSATFTINTYRSPVTKTVTIQAALGQVVLTGPGQVVLTTPLTITGG